MAIPITEGGVKKLREELEHLWTVERPRVTREVTAAAEQGDRSENAEYIYGKRRLREIDRRVRFLRKRFDELVVVKPEEVDQERVFFGAWVTLKSEDGEKHRYRLVGPDESDPDSGWISIASPMGRALVGKREDDEVTVKRPAGSVIFTIVKLEYESS